MTRTTVLLNPDLHTHFKMHLISKKMTMQDAISDAILMWLEANGAPFEMTEVKDDKPPG